jgi:uncharacterized protein YndB with AHSA1/START domain
VWSNAKVSDFASSYPDIVSDQRIDYAYDMHIDTERISATLATTEFAPYVGGTLLRVTEQGAHLDTFDKPEMRELGTKALLDRMAASPGGPT